VPKLSSEEIKVCIASMKRMPVLHKIVKRRLIWRLPSLGHLKGGSSLKLVLMMSLMV